MLATNHGAPICHHQCNLRPRKSFVFQNVNGAISTTDAVHATTTVLVRLMGQEKVLRAVESREMYSIGFVIVRPLSTAVGYTSVVASVIDSRQWSN